MAIAADGAAPFLDVADPGFSVRSAQVRQAREAGWYARSLAVRHKGNAADAAGLGGCGER